MSQSKYSVISVGGAGASSSASAKAFLTEVKGMTALQVKAVLEGVPTIIQQGIDEETAAALAETMKDIGLKCHVVEQTPTTNLKLVGSNQGSADSQKHKTTPRMEQPQQYRREDILDGFHETVKPVKLSLVERIKMAALAITMLAMPAGLAASVIALLAFAVYLSEGAFAVMGPGSESMPWLQWVAAFLVLGFTSVLIHRSIGDWRREKKYVHLDRDRHPQVYLLVEKIAELMGVKAPVSIKLDAEVGVVLRPKEFFSPISGYRSELIIGLPLFYSLNVRQLAGVITHAFSGLSMQAGRFGYPIISALNGWLYRCASSKLDKASISFDPQHKYLNGALYALVWPFDMAARLYFKVLYVFASALSFSTSRKMDMQADLQSAQVSGSNEFRSTQFRLRALHYGQTHARAENKIRMESGHVVPNYSAFVVDYAEALRIELKPTLINEMEQLVTPLTRSRVVDLGRIVNVEKHQFEGSCFLLGRAIDLLSNVDELSREITRRHYISLGYQDLDQDNGKAYSGNAVLSRNDDSLNYTFMGWQKSGRYLRFDEFHSHENLSLQAKCQDLRDLVSKLAATEEQLTSMANRYQYIDDRANQLHVSKTLQEAGVDKPNQQLIDNAKELRETETTWLKTLNQQGVLRGDLTYYEALISQRISLALSLAKQTPELKDVIGINDLDEYIDYLKDSAAFLYKAYESVARLRTYTFTLGALVNAGQIENRETLQPFFNRYENYCRVELDSILNVLSAVAYPLQLPQGLENSLEQPSIAEVLRYTVKGIDNTENSISLCFKVCHSTLKFLDGFSKDLMLELDRMVYETESYYSIERE